MAFRAVSIDALLVERQRFDMVIFADVLEHLDAPQAVLAHGVQLLQWGGRALVTVPNGFGPFEVESWLSRLPGFGRASLWAVDHFVAVLDRFVFKGAWTAAVTPPNLPYNAECGHVRFFTRGALLAVTSRAELRLLRETGLSWLSGPYTNYLFAPSRVFCALNTRVADWLPSWMLSGWFFEFARVDDDSVATGVAEQAVG
jgi:SAM-dependent methyltransferase